MLRTTSRLPRPVLSWVSQVTASLGATLAATVIWSAVPHPSAGSAPRPELTSGGKFAARAVDAVAYDGLDTMPLPRIAPPAGAAAPSPYDLLQRAAWESAPASAAPERPSRAARPVRPATHAEAHRAPAAGPEVRAAPAPAEPAPEARGGEGALAGVLPAIASTARDAWTITASAGTSLVARVVPQMP